MKLTIDMPNVSKCNVEACAYNTGRTCHARAITVGDGQQPGCDTFFPASSHSKASQCIAGVGACKVTGCRYNDDFECTTDSIQVGYSGSDVLCLTYQAR